jgi:hypothetical protein
VTVIIALASSPGTLCGLLAWDYVHCIGLWLMSTLIIHCFICFILTFADRARLYEAWPPNNEVRL